MQRRNCWKKCEPSVNELKCEKFGGLKTIKKIVDDNVNLILRLLHVAIGVTSTHYPSSVAAVSEPPGCTKRRQTL